MNKGYCIEGGMEYFCCDECLHTAYSEDEYLELYDGGEGDTYWTEWDEEGGTVNSQTFEPHEDGV